MKRNNEFKETDTKYCSCYHFDDIININDVDLENNLIYNFAYKTPYGGYIIFNKVDGVVYGWEQNGGVKTCLRVSYIF